MANRWDVNMLRRLLLLLVLLCSAAHSDGKEMYSIPGFAGRVTDRETGRPIEGAIVVVRWGGAARSMATGMFVCVHVAHAITDADGRYRVSGWRSQAPQFSVDGFNWTADVYKPGYGQSRPASQPNITMPKWTSTPDEQVRFLAFFAGRNDCLDDEGEGRKLGAALHRRLLEDVEQSDASPAAKSREMQYFRQRIQYLEKEPH
jgi:hypothetical protein